MAAIPDPVTHAASVFSIAASAFDSVQFVGVKWRLYKNAFSDLPSKQSVMSLALSNANVAESEIQGLTPFNCPVFSVFWSRPAGSIGCLAKLVKLFTSLWHNQRMIR